MAVKYNEGDLIGPHKVQLLKITKITEYGHRYGLFLCPICQERTFESKIYHVSSGSTFRCKNCKKKAYSGKNNFNFVNLQGQKFGKLLVKEYIGSKHAGYDSKGNHLTRSLWLCECDCGREVEVDSNMLNAGFKNSCGYCGLKSNGEYRIAYLLEQMKINYITQKTFDECKNPETSHKLLFDFYLPDYNCCIEYDGTSHYIPNEYGSWNTPENVLKTQTRDKIKNEFCANNNIRLIRIPFYEFNEIDEQYLIDKITR